MKFVLRQAVISRLPEIDLDEGVYKQLVQARHNLTDFTSIEEKLDLVLENHLEFEKEISGFAARDMMFRGSDAIDLWTMGNVFNRRILNTMSSCRSYLDHTDHHICNVYGNTSDQRALYSKLRCEIYDNNPEFRIVEALRNFVQHRGFPLHNWTIGSEKKGNKPNFEWEYRVGLRLHSEILEKDNRFNKKALGDIKAFGGTVDLVWLMRGYIKLLSQINQFLRGMFAVEIESAYIIIKAHLHEYRLLCAIDYDPPSLAAVSLHDDGTPVKTTYLVPEALYYREKFVSKNWALDNLNRSYISSRSNNDQGNI